jgi:MraZ protein
MASAATPFLFGEFRRTIDERFRLSIPAELADPLVAEGNECILAKERSGCLSLWNAKQWAAKLDAEVQLVQGKILAGRLEGKIEQVQLLGRLLSTRHKTVELAGRGRLLLPEGFREFLGAETGGEVMVVGAAVCVEVWRTDAWLAHLAAEMPSFRKTLDELVG